MDINKAKSDTEDYIYLHFEMGPAITLLLFGASAMLVVNYRSIK